MLFSKRFLRFILLLGLASAFSMAFVSQVSFAAQVRVCKKIKQSSEVKVKKSRQKKVFCTIKPATGRIGDIVEIKNQYNYIVATGKIVKRGRTSSVMILTGYKKDLGSMAGYPVLVRDDDNQDFWTATTAPF